MPSRELKDLTPFLQTVWLNLSAKFEFEHHKEGLFLKLVCTHRTPEEQQNLWKKGRDEKGIVVEPKKVLTNCDGIRTKSNHNYYPARAFDVGIFKKTASKDVYCPDHPLEKQLGKYVVGVPARWGGNYRSFKDYPHFEEV